MKEIALEPRYDQSAPDLPLESAGRLSPERVGIVLVALCAVNGAFVPPVAKITTRAADPLAVTIATTWLAAATAVVILLVRRRLAVFFRPAVLFPLAVLGALGTSVAFVLFFTGAARASAIETLLCLQIEPVYSLLLSWLVLGIRPTWERVAATALILSGLFVAVGVQGFSVGSGTWYLLATPLCWQVSHLVVVRWLRGLEAVVLTAARYIWGAVLLSLFTGKGPLAGIDRLDSSPFPWGWVALQGVVLSYGGTTLWYGAIARIDLARATVLVVPTVPVLSILASFFLLGEVPSMQQLAGAAITSVGVFAFARKGIEASARPRSVGEPVSENRHTLTPG
ncbi:MAG: DMT family transporter [Candidatus Binatia bacterium]|nr:DMT family transporter [Candidatus Binatia bacterium]